MEGFNEKIGNFVQCAKTPCGPTFAFDHLEKNCRQEIVVSHRCQPKPRPFYWHFPYYTNQGNAETWVRVAEWRKQMNAVLRKPNPPLR